MNSSTAMGHRRTAVWLLSLVLLALTALPAAANAQVAAVVRWTVDGGGGASSGGGYTLMGTVGQADAGPSTLTGGSFTLVGGFWAGFQVERHVYLPLVPK